MRKIKLLLLFLVTLTLSSCDIQQPSPNPMNDHEIQFEITSNSSSQMQATCLVSPAQGTDYFVCENEEFIGNYSNTFYANSGDIVTGELILLAGNSYQGDFTLNIYVDGVLFITSGQYFQGVLVQEMILNIQANIP